MKLYFHKLLGGNARLMFRLILIPSDPQCCVKEMEDKDKEGMPKYVP